MSRRWLGGRWGVLLPLLAIAAVLALFGDKTPPGAVVQRAAPRSVAIVAAAASHTSIRHVANPTAVGGHAGPAAPESIETLIPRAGLAVADATPAADLFRNAAWRARPVPPAVPPASVRPVQLAAPAASYRVIGKQHDGDTWLVFLGRDEQSFIVREGETIEAIWRVDRIEPPTLTWTHLPTGLVQTLAIGEAR